MRILVTGGEGQLGKSIRDRIHLNNNIDFIFPSKQEMDFLSMTSIENYFESNENFDVIVNCAAYTSVDEAEKEEKIANQINNLAVRKLAEISASKEIRLIHISTDYVYSGESKLPYVESDVTEPINIYGKTKLEGEIAIKQILPYGAIIIRTGWLYSKYGNNFVKTILKLIHSRKEITVVDDQIGSPTYADDLANVILKIINDNSFQFKNYKSKVFHYSNNGEISWLEFAVEIYNLSNANCILTPIKSDQMGHVAKRPKMSVMSKDRIVKEFSIDLKPWKNSLKEMCNKNPQLFNC